MTDPFAMKDATVSLKQIIKEAFKLLSTWRIQPAVINKPLVSV